jgi:hypothetical protein
MVKVFLFPVLFEDVLAPAPPGATRKWAKDRIWQMRPEVSSSVLFTTECRVAFGAHKRLGRCRRIGLRDLNLRWRWHKYCEGK